MTTGGYDAHATARWVPEPPKRPGRGPFERDRARVLHSAALRRLAAKTQVVEVGSGDFPRTRLTHSLECAQIGRELGAELGCDPDLVDAACLAHDLGHPPFGHNGESALADLAAGCGGFEGNAQSLRLLTRLEAKVPGAGLNLTRATLDGTLKYPWPAPDGDLSAPPKYGVYADDAEAFAWIRDGAPPGRLCLEAQVMDWADDIAYSVHDLEDGLHSGLITMGALRDPAERKAVAGLTAATYCAPGSVTVDELGEIFAALLELPCWPAGFDGGLSSLAALKNLTSELIGRFCRLRAGRDAGGRARRQPGRADPVRGRPRRPPAAAPGVRAAEGRHRAVRDGPRRSRGVPGPGAGADRRAGRRRAGRARLARWIRRSGPGTPRPRRRRPGCASSWTRSPR